MLISVTFIVAMNIIWYTWIGILSQNAYRERTMVGTISAIMRENRELTAALVGTVNILFVSVLSLEYSTFTNLSKTTTGSVATGLLMITLIGLGMLLFFYSAVVLDNDAVHTELGHASGVLMYVSITIFTLLSIRQCAQRNAVCVTGIRIGLWITLTTSAMIFLISNWSAALNKEDFRLSQHIMLASFFMFFTTLIYEALPQRGRDAAISSSQRRIQIALHTNKPPQKGAVKRLESLRQSRR